MSTPHRPIAVDPRRPQPTDCATRRKARAAQNLGRRRTAQQSARPARQSRRRCGRHLAAGLAARSPPLITAALDGDYAAVERLLRGDRTDARRRRQARGGHRGRTGHGDRRADRRVAGGARPLRADAARGDRRARGGTRGRRDAAARGGKIDSRGWAPSRWATRQRRRAYRFSYGRRTARAGRSAGRRRRRGGQAKAAAAAVAMQVEAGRCRSRQGGGKAAGSGTPKAAKRWSNKFVLGRTFSAWLAALATARSSARDEARARLLVPLEHAGLSDRLAAAVGFARAEGVAAAAEISAHGLVSAFVAALAPLDACMSPRCVTSCAAPPAAAPTTRSCVSRERRRCASACCRRCSARDWTRTWRRSAPRCSCMSAAASDVAVWVGGRLAQRDRRRRGHARPRESAGLRAELRDAAAAAAPAVADVGSRSPRRFW